MRIIIVSTLLCLPVATLGSMETSAFETCVRSPRIYVKSASCYNIAVPERSDTGRFDISKKTFRLMLDALNQPANQRIPSNSPLYTNLKMLGNEITALPDDYMLFFYYDNDDDGLGNSDCSVYTASETNIESMERLSPKIASDPCDDASYHFAVVYKYITEPESVLLISPVEQYLFAAHPDPNFDYVRENAAIDHWMLFNKQFDVNEELALQSVEVISSLEIPTWRYINNEVNSLPVIAERLKLGSIPWELLWELNIKSIKDPFKVIEDIELVVPARIQDWYSIEYFGQSPEELAKENYGDASYAQLVQQYVDRVYLQQDKETLFLPVFDKHAAIELVPVTSLSRF